MDKKNIKLVITDLDNTLYNWFLPWYKSFKIFIDDVLNETDIEEKELLEQIQLIHQKYGTSEYSFDFLIKELELFQKNYPKEKIDNLRHKFYKTKKHYLKLYPGVLESLILIKQSGCKIVAYTESMEFYAKDRFRKLGLDGIIDELYSPEDHDIPSDFKRYYNDDYYELKSTKYHKISLSHKKPDTFIIDQIRKNFPFSNDEILYIGDSLTKDIFMAQNSSIIDVFAKYGTVHHSEEYELLRKVTHWTNEEVEKEKHVSIKDIQPSYILKASFVEIFNYFDFNKNNYESIDSLIKIWDRTIDVQKHFNDIELKLRQLVISLSSMFLGGFIALISTNKIDKIITINNIKINTLSLSIFITAFVWVIFYLVDRYWYHPLLKGAVKEGKDIENKLSKVLPINGLTNTISKSSPIKFLSFTINSSTKMNLFYWSIIIPLIIIGCLLL